MWSVLAEDDRTVVLAMKIAWKVARRQRMQISNGDTDELRSVALLAVVEALRNFDPAKGNLKARVMSTTKWRIKDYLRSIDHLGRHQRAKTNKDRHLMFDDKQELSNPILSLDASSNSDPRNTAKTTLADNLGFYPDISQKVLVDQILKSLEPRTRLMFELYFFEGFSKKEIGQKLNITEGRVSQVMTKAATEIKTKGQECLQIQQNRVQ